MKALAKIAKDALVKTVDIFENPTAKTGDMKVALSEKIFEIEVMLQNYNAAKDRIKLPANSKTLLVSCFLSVTADYNL